jgi:hypothetical protein
MKISAQTLNILKNFSGINASILVKPGSVLKTLSPQNNIMAEATVTESFGTGFAIYDLSQFLSAVSLFDDADFDFQDTFVRINQGNRAIRYYFADPSMVKAASDKKVVLPSVDLAFDLTEKQLNEILKAASVLQVPEIAVVSNGASKTRVVSTDTKNSTSNDFSVEVDHESESKFKLIFKAENLKMIAGDYKVEICAKGIARFANDKLGVEYFIATESSSEFTK